MTTVSDRVETYWTKRARDFNVVRRNELQGDISERWLAELGKYLPAGRALKILDVGTGTGYFAILLGRQGHEVIGIDLTEAMLEEAKRNAADFQVTAKFIRMDAQKTEFPDEYFDAVVTRNLTWTLPDPAAAYREWYRVLKKDGILLNFDASYADNVRHNRQSDSYVDTSSVYGHCGVTPALQKESDDITLEMPCAEHTRPDWDVKILKEAGFAECGFDLQLGQRVLLEHDLEDAPMFLVRARK